MKEWSACKKSLLQFHVEEYVSPYRNEDSLASMGTSTVYDMEWRVPPTTNSTVSDRWFETPKRPPEPEPASNSVAQGTSSMTNTSIDLPKDTKNGKDPIVISNKPGRYDSFGQGNCTDRTQQNINMIQHLPARFTVGGNSPPWTSPRKGGGAYHYGPQELGRILGMCITV